MGKRKKLLVFHQALAPYRIDLWNGLNKYFDADIYFIYGNLLEQKFNQDKLKEKLDFTPKYLDGGFRIGERAFKWGFLPIIRKKKPDIVITYEYSQTTLFIYWIKKIFGFSFQIYSMCDDSLHLATSRKGVREAVRKYLVKRIDGLIVVNREVADWYKKTYPLKNDCLFFPIIAKDEIFRKQLMLALPQSNNYIRKYKLEGQKCILFVGRLVKIKGLDRLLTAFANAVKTEPESKLIIVGEGDQLPVLQSMAKELFLEDKVLFAGRFEGIDLLAWYNIGQLFILPSHSEAFGAVVNEALLSGQRVLCSSYAGASEIIDPLKNGALFNPFDLDELTGLIKSELGNLEGIELISTIRDSNMIHLFEEYFRSFKDQLEHQSNIPMS
jgi:glycosyltransferase involved in cell wall biosynthesis